MVNAVGTKNVNMEFYKYMNDGGVIVDIASSSAYEAPGLLVKHQIFEEAEYQEEKFIKHMTGEAMLPPGEENDPGMAYVLSKKFVVWYAQKCAHEYAKKGIRVVSVSPGLIETDMGTREAEAWDYTKEMIENTCEQRMGTAAEMGFTIAMIADERNGYLRGIDVLVDGGASTGKQFKKK
jgi:NAD(P)-dependent dehydrogenase (short-subunit alcohol dehydrogenase family)